MLPSDRGRYKPLSPPFTGEDLRRHLEETRPLIERGRWWYRLMTPVRLFRMAWQSLNIYEDEERRVSKLETINVDFRVKNRFTHEPISLRRKESLYFWALVSVSMFLWGVVVAIHAAMEAEPPHPGSWIAFTLYCTGFGVWSYFTVKKALYPRPRFYLSTDAVISGGQIKLFWRYSSPLSRLSNFNIVLRGEEWSQYVQGTTTVTATHSIAVIRVVPEGMGAKEVLIELPADMPPSFNGIHSGINWFFEIDYVDFKETYPVQIASMPSRNSSKERA